ncbi:MAG: hypothetical protein DRP60_11925 [Spirochaetes bacterium]|nr:MAG: hypothetical protein DRP60_11925 [Spirochaetota bacterium]
MIISFHSGVGNPSPTIMLAEKGSCQRNKAPDLPSAYIYYVLIILAINKKYAILISLILFQRFI